MLRTVLTLVLCCFAAAAEGQYPAGTVTTLPPSPTSSTPVILVLNDVCDCPTFELHAVNGSNVDLTYPPSSACPAVCLPVDQSLHLGLLPAGTYTVRLVSQPPDPPATVVVGEFVVGQGAAAGVPTLGEWGAAALAVLLSALAIRRLRVA